MNIQIFGTKKSADIQTADRTKREKSYGGILSGGMEEMGIELKYLTGEE